MNWKSNLKNIGQFGPRSFAIVFFLCFVQFSVQSQTVFYSNSFDNSPFGSSWITESINDQGPTPPPGAALWTWTADGRASQGAYWEGRPPINSPSGGGAIVFNSDFLDNGGIPKNSCGNGATSCVPHEGLAISPNIQVDLNTLAPDSAVGLIFNQYYRGFQSQGLVEISTDGGNNWFPIPINEELSQRTFGGESEATDLQILNLMPFLQPGINNFQIRFHFMGEYYFWIIDDVRVQTIPIDDISLSSLIYPPENQYCYFGSEELIQIELCNQGAAPQDSFFVTLEIGRQRSSDFINFPIVLPLQPNECATVAIDTLVDLSDFIFLNVFVEVPQDLNPQNNQINYFNPYQLCQDSLGGEYICTHAIIRFKNGTPPVIKDSIRAKYSATLLKSCGCDSLELWDVPYPIMIPGGPIINPEEGVKKMVEEPDVEEGGLNYVMAFSALNPPIPGTYSQNGGSQARDSILIGVIDTGIDFFHDSIQERFWENAEELSDPFATDEDSNCIAQDNWGYNLIEPEKIPYDDHIRGHGTHVSGIILADLPESVDLQLLAVKAMGQNGRGGLFELLCGSQYLIDEGAKVANMSMGYTGVKSDILDSMMKRLYMADVLVVSSAGNDSLDNDKGETPHWPSNFAMDYPNIFAVAALNKAKDQLNPISNFGEMTVNIAAPGTEIYSLLPGDEFGPKDGTSMAAAAVSRAAAIYRASCPEASAVASRDYILSVADTLEVLLEEVSGGKILNLNDSLYFNISCLTNLEKEWKEGPVRSYPNPFVEKITLEFQASPGSNYVLEVYDIQGKRLERIGQTILSSTGIIKWKTSVVRKGVYIYKVSENGKLMSTGKWIKQ
ncbi:MAG: S8 family peptidase [Bacteroidia bacterium]|nr:S8 family peptidase [Bacteroidia bacterium]